ncbi:MAG: hypothetical protein B7Y88_15430 [Sphingomonadales bacterium 32-64-17]|nr:MAG: hypothetical protein B7Y88_15430 [Sphingomonadales bacterium 32-64-17]
MGAIYEFGVARNARVVKARIKGTAHSALDRVWGLFGAKFHNRPANSVYGVPMVPNFSDKTFRYCLYGTYGKYFSSYLDSIDYDFTFIDIGANQGLYSLVAARNPHCRKIIAFEPVKGTFDFLAANIELNGAADRSVLLNAALSDHAGTAEIAVKANHSGVASLAGHSGMEGRPTETITLMDVAGLDAHIPGDLPIIIKIDVEGHEGVVIAQLLKSAHFDRVKAVFHEMDERWAEAPKIRRMLVDGGFSKFRKFGIRRHYDILAER